MRQLGLDLGGTRIKLAVLADGRCVASDEAETRSEEGPDAVLERIVALGRGAGTVASAGDFLFDPLRASLEARARVAPLDRTAVVPATLGPSAGAIGAALYAAG